MALNSLNPANTVHLAIDWQKDCVDDLGDYAQYLTSQVHVFAQ